MELSNPFSGIHAENYNSVRVKFGMILMAKMVFYTYFDVCSDDTFASKLNLMVRI